MSINRGKNGPLVDNVNKRSVNLFTKEGQSKPQRHKPKVLNKDPRFKQVKLDFSKAYEFNQKFQESKENSDSQEDIESEPPTQQHMSVKEMQKEMQKETQKEAHKSSVNPAQTTKKVQEYTEITNGKQVSTRSFNNVTSVPASASVPASVSASIPHKQPEPPVQATKKVTMKQQQVSENVVAKSTEIAQPRIQNPPARPVKKLNLFSKSNVENNEITFVEQ